MSLSGGQSKGSGSNQSQSTGNSQQYGSDVWGAQSPFLADLYGRGQNALNSMNATADATPYLGDARTALASARGSLDASQANLQQFLTPNSANQLNAYATNLGQQFREQFLPGLQGNAALAGGLGGSRQQIGAALGGQRAMQSLGDFTAQTYAGDQDRALQAATQMAGNAQGYGQLATGQAGLADFARSMPWYNLSQYQGLLGAPIMQDLGGYSTNQSTSSGTQKTSQWNMSGGIGGR